MRVTGTTFVVDEGPVAEGAKGRDGLLRKLAETGMNAQRAISHNQSWSVMQGRVWPHRYAEPVLDLYRVYGFKTLWDNLNHNALPRHGDRWVDEAGDNVQTQEYSEPIFRQFLETYIPYMAQPGMDYCVTWGNEPDADDSPYLNDEQAFRDRYRVLAEVVTKLRASKTFRGNVTLGAGGYCQDWQRAAAFVAWVKSEGLPLDFIEIHCYIDSDRVRQAVKAIRAVSPDIRIVIGECGAEWDHRIKQPTAAFQRAWFREMEAACDECRITDVLLMHGVGPTTVRALALMGPRGGLTPIGKLAVRSR